MTSPLVRVNAPPPPVTQDLTSNSCDIGLKSREMDRPASAALLFATQTFILLPNLNQYLFFLSKSSTPQQVSSPHSMDLYETTPETPEPARLDPQETDRHSDCITTSASSPLSGEQEPSQQVLQQKVERRLESSTRLPDETRDEFRRTGAMLRELSDQFAR